MKLIVVRHGQTEENVAGILQGHLPGKLTELGIEQARKVAKRLKDEKIDAIYSSDLARASDTAKEIATYHPNADIYFVTELREKNHRGLTGKNVNEIDWSKPRDTEKSDKMAIRAKAIFDKAYEKYKGKTVLFVSHGGLIRILALLIMNKSLESRKELKESVNTGVSIFEIKEDKNNNVILLNCGKHL